jgi:hypothetical protein
MLDGKDQVSAGPQPARYAPDKRVVARYIVQREAADNQVHALGCQAEGLGAGAAVPYTRPGVAGGQGEHTPGWIDAKDMAGAPAGEPARERAITTPDIQYVTAGDSRQHPGEGLLF